MLLLKEAITEIRRLPRSPGEEDPNVSSREQVMGLLGHYSRNGVMRFGRDYAACDRIRGIWKWKTRTVRLAGMYFEGPHRFVIAHAEFARGLKRSGGSVVEKEAEFADIAADRLQGIGLLRHAWKTKDPHHVEALSFDSDPRR